MTYIFGANILENLTTGMYQDSKVIYREYIQNSCDQIDKALKSNILKPGEGHINIWLDRDQRKITIEDNATGIPKSLFQNTLGNIADSDKKIGEDKGFRGIGRLCGLAYCKEVVFTSSSKGEDTISIMKCNAQKMRNLIDENSRGKKYTANEILNEINQFESEPTTDIDSHFFRVELNGINFENTDLLDFQQIKDYLSFVAPVPYQSSFYYRTEIYSHAQNLGVKIDEYNITLDGESILKKYTTILKDSNTGIKYDEIFGVHFQNFYKDSELIAWMWVGISKFQKAIPKVNQMRGLRLRKENIQIGGEDSLLKLFKQERGNSYFVGEVFAVNKNLIPNSQRDYFNENQDRVIFERELRKYFNDELQKIYYNGSTINSAIKKIDTYERINTEFHQKSASGVFVDEDHRDRELEFLEKSRIEASNAIEKFTKMKDNSNGLMKKVLDRIEKDNSQSINNRNLQLSTEDLLEPIKVENTKPTRRADKVLSQYNNKERKLISKIFSIITRSVDSDTAELIISKIEEELK